MILSSLPSANKQSKENEHIKKYIYNIHKHSNTQTDQENTNDYTDNFVYVYLQGQMQYEKRE